MSLASGRVATLRACALLDVERRLATSHTQGVRLVVALSERTGTLGL